MIKLIRMDDRLLHGQVMANWVNGLNIGGVLIVSDAVAKDDMRKMALNLAKPSSMKLFIKNMAEGIAALEKLNGFSYNSMILTENAKDTLALVEGSPVLSGITVNIGGQRPGEDRHRVSDTLCLSDEDIGMIRKMEDLGAKVEIRKLSSERAKTLADIMKDIK